MTRTVLLRGLALILLALCSTTSARAGQLGAFVAPGPLSKAHANLEGVGKCTTCHEPGRNPSAARCLSCHEPIAERIAAKTGVHRAVTDNCTACHVEHGGADADLRRIDAQKFDHATETGFPLDGQHAKTATNCAACHKARSFLDAKTACSACHADVHKGTLGAACEKCHSTRVRFKQSRAEFDHTRARFQLAGAHQQVACEKCHKAGTFRGVEFATCAACHEDPHRKKFGAVCASCHTTTDRWETRSVTHSKTAFPLVGAHAQVACAKCHTSGSMTKPVRFDQCSACHVNVHRESLKEDCRACHTETSFQGAPFEHVKRTSFALEDKHQGLGCRQCHTSISAADVPLARKIVDFGGAKSECVACHGEKDPHKGEFGRVCDSCHRPATFKAKDFTHPRAPDFYAGQHEAVACEKCHVPGKALQPIRTGASLLTVAKVAAPSATSSPRDPTKPPSMECASCHSDVHLGQVGLACDQCHAVSGVKFAAVKFSHERSAFTLTGKHREVECAKCHKTETRAFPSGTGTAVRFHPVETSCLTCHKDPHLGQVDLRCETCHETTTFKIASFVHRGMDDFFGGLHGKYACKDCHKSETGQFPAGSGTAVRFLVGRTCAACHRAF